jgi:uncharacterized repeat protein (TIGR03943 family)
MRLISRILGPLTLLEWGVILSYFYFSGRVAAFLHPMFRPLVLVTGFLLILTAACVAFLPDGECSHSHDDELLHEHNRLSPKSVIAFVVLLLPLALAVAISPDDYGATIIRNRGLVEDIRGLPAVAASKPVAAPASVPEPPMAAGSLKSTAEGSSELPPTVTASGSQEEQPATATASDPVSLPEKSPVENEDGTTTERSGDAIVTYQNDALKPDKQGNIKAQITDLLWAAQEPYTRKDFEGKRVELIGQFVGEKSRGNSRTFHLMRMVMVCCAADMMPAAVKVEPATKIAAVKEMGWLKIAGICYFRPRAKPVGDDGIDYGNYPEAVIVADHIVRTKPPREKYIY